ncbi:MAG: hypothetical protein LBU58_02600 [Clostridiales bacterium]|jgi:uncharacterized membrane protein|nr:hypothetical protein [Clostridiales bacterium]
MCCERIAQYGKRQKAARLMAVLVCVCFVAALILSSAFILTHANHEHDRNGADGSCAACAHISAVENLLKTISAVTVFSVVALGTTFAALLIMTAARIEVADYSLVELKVRLNN